jgi:hypothetical protein
MALFTADEWNSARPLTPKAPSRKIVLKGHGDVHEIDVNELERIVSTLRDNADVSIKLLSGEIKSCFQQFTDYVDLLHGSDAYIQFMEIVSEYFSNVEQIRPGTIGAYCYGCQNGRSECSHICAGSAPAADENFSFCHESVIVGDYNGYDFDFTAMRIGDSSETYLYVNFDSYDSFPGFTRREIEALEKDYHCSSVYLRGYSNSSTEYFELLNESIMISNIKIRVDRKGSRRNGHDSRRDYLSDISSDDHSDNSSSQYGKKEKREGAGLVLLLVVIFIIILAIVLAYSYYNPRPDSKKQK